jgi:hypothetical protein
MTEAAVLMNNPGAADTSRRSNMTVGRCRGDEPYGSMSNLISVSLGSKNPVELPRLPRRQALELLNNACCGD